MTPMFKALWTRLTGGRNASVQAAMDAVECNGFRIRPTPYETAGRYQIAGIIEKDFPEGTKQHRFVRADTDPSEETAAAFAIVKAQRIIDEQGERLFANEP